MGTPLDRDSQASLLRPGLGSSRKEILPGEVCSNKKLKSLDKWLGHFMGMELSCPDYTYVLYQIISERLYAEVIQEE